eukprot:m.146321 g.146321  ORF g.146321 m.146321 type:complete len:74 (+) comp9697_c0_seq7:2206-2427(+)
MNFLCGLPYHALLQAPPASGPSAPDDQILVSAGLRGSRTTNKFLVYDIETDAWSALRSLPFCSTEMCVAAVTA